MSPDSFPLLRLENLHNDRIDQFSSQRPVRPNERLWNGRCARKAGHVRYVPILLKNSKVASAPLFDAILKREAIDDSDISSRATEVAYAFCVRR